MDKIEESTRANEMWQADHQILSAEGLHKSYESRPALRGLSFTLNAGRILGFLGPNGAGKTTAIRILTTMMEPDAGHFVVNGISCDYPQIIRQVIGVLPENMGFPKQITGIEYLTYFGQLYGRATAEAKTNARVLLEEVGMQQRATSLIRTYSHGMRQRLGIARALVNSPAVVFLDEPTLGLDPRGQRELLDLIRRIARERHVGVILCSHALSEIEDVCDDVVILSSGQVVAKGSVGEVLGRTQLNVMRIRVPAFSIAAAKQVLETTPNVLRITVPSEMVGLLRVELVGPADRISSEQPHVPNTILEALIHAQIPILSFEAEGGRLQDIFLHLTEEVIQ